MRASVLGEKLRGTNPCLGGVVGGGLRRLGEDLLPAAPVGGRLSGGMDMGDIAEDFNGQPERRLAAALKIKAKGDTTLRGLPPLISFIR
jgi:hypothetical protein